MTDNQRAELIRLHIKYVQEAAVTLGGIPWEQIAAHDLSKFTAIEFPYFPTFYKGWSNPADRDGFARAWLHHIHHNPHHPEHWVFPHGVTPQGSSVENGLVEMPAVYVREMVADWMGSSMTYTDSWDMTEWLKANLPRIKLHSRSRAYLNEILVDELGYPREVVEVVYE